MNNKNMDPVTLLKLFDIMDTPFDKACSCGQSHRTVITDFDLNSHPTVPFSKWKGRCDTHYQYLQRLPITKFGTELDAHLKLGFLRKLIPISLKLLAFFTDVRVKGYTSN
jgi:hypothetical protein